MTQLAILGTLVDELLESIIDAPTNLSKGVKEAVPGRDSHNYRGTTKSHPRKEQILRTLRNREWARTNPFDVYSRLDGLDEKFRVYGQDFLANALYDQRRKIEEISPQWAPEILHFILELSERSPTTLTHGDIALARELPSEPTPPLRWEDLRLEDPLLRDEIVWQNVSFSDESTDGEDEFRDSVNSTEGPDKVQNYSRGDNSYIRLEDFEVKTNDQKGFQEVIDSQFWRSLNTHLMRPEVSEKKVITEVQAAREVLFLYSGYPTSLFQVTKYEDKATINISDIYSLNHISQDTFFSLLRSFTNQASAVLNLRVWVACSQKAPLIQVFQLFIQDKLLELDTYLSQIQQRLIDPVEDVVVSLVGIKQETIPLLRPLISLAEIITKFNNEPYGHSFRCLEMLYDKTCISQINGDNALYIFHGNLFFKCLQIYIRPIRSWIEEGELQNGDSDFFVSETASDISLPLLWESRFKIRKMPDGTLYAPRFLKPAAGRIFNTGKSIVVLKHLHKFDILQSTTGHDEPKLDFDTVCNQPIFHLAPFSELFDMAFDAWVRSKHRHAASILKKTLFSSCGLHTSLDALSHIYFLANGSIGTEFTSFIFENLETSKASWIDKFALVEHAQSTFGSISTVSSERLGISLLPLTQGSEDTRKDRLSIKALSILTIHYPLSWPIQIVVRPTTIISYQRIFTFLLQVRRSSYFLSRQPIRVDSLDHISRSDERLPYFSFRMRLLWFTQTLYHYLTCLVLEPCSQKMQADLKMAEDVDMMIEVHSTYIKKCIDQALLCSKLDLIHANVLKVLELGIKLEEMREMKIAVNRTNISRNVSEVDYMSLDPGHAIDDTYCHDYGTVRQPRNLESCGSDEKIRPASSIHDTASSPDESSLVDEPYALQLRHLEKEFHHLVNFVSRGLKGAARAVGSEDARLWDILGEMLECGLTG
ncbi:BgTH12-07616 [Blumeria graminis f. sp. triticale]|uniref:Spindle pole body component n=1 Tax=Blumeria graminis f. sp. triticale TaxID=1689686 RepID=A0A9W4GCD0_BLUGR|nr:BgTH12-07616 [Blumeria graminis f. sp. triticale]